jgi:hypothetical protein
MSSKQAGEAVLGLANLHTALLHQLSLSLESMPMQPTPSSTPRQRAQEREGEEDRGGGMERGMHTQNQRSVSHSPSPPDDYEGGRQGQGGGSRRSSVTPREDRRSSGVGGSGSGSGGQGGRSQSLQVCRLSECVSCRLSECVSCRLSECVYHVGCQNMCII